VAFSPTEQVLVAGDATGLVRIFKVPSLEELPPIGRPYGGIHALAFSHDGRQLASGSHRLVGVWDWPKRVQQRNLYGHTKGIWGMAYSPDDTELATAGFDSSIRIFQSATGSPVPPSHLRGFGRDWLFGLWLSLTDDPPPTLTGHGGAVVEVAYSPDGRRLASTSADGTIRIWETASGRTLHTLRGCEGHWSGVAFSPSGKLLAGSGEGGRVLLWNATSGALERTLSGHDGPVTHLTFGRDDRQLSSASLDDTVRLWDTSSGEVRHIFRQHTDMVLGIAFSPDGKHLASAGQDGRLVLWHADPVREQGPCVARRLTPGSRGVQPPPHPRLRGKG
jgi:WD40 repeat protein